ncbi:MAG TPA: MFS transporter [Zoogloea sp.]|uniref:MFS transporter n=1 Tax=Zoogloea sp. TaxID=49181 RepID=UPI002D008C75|nr:MFS transporter [Zoogloea sp.]HMV64563.1 MFS transporter [Rhodocyclaceae bacterium]HNB64953.1 MFS transporter [Rhodocyclaceae bacterium]HND25175.1 MFS transporter [Rhodocyclaceae bacterium]HNI47699.1 MFS transporter [Zoogloea sp.]HNI81278.1 MFS transporter [Rhodocyclaceae bacterium]
MKTSDPAGPGASHWPLVLLASAVLMITMGVRQSLGLYLSPLNTATGLGVASISFAMAVGQFMWGAAQPVFGAVADRYGPARALFTGAVMLVAGLALTPFVTSETGLILCLGVLVAAGAGAGSFSILIGALAQRVPPQKRAFASGFINAGGSFGQFLFAPLSQFLITGYGWVVALFGMAAAAALTIPLSWPLRHKVEHPPAESGAETGLKAQLRVALRDRSYWCLHAGFFTCGFHIAFLVTHLPGAVNLCGLPASVSAVSLAVIGLANIVGSLGAGALGQHYRMKWILAVMYASRAVLVALYLMAPKTEWTFYLFAVGLGVTWLATVPPTAGLVGKLFGLRYLATLFGLTLLSHQIGGFFGAWLGGLALVNFGNYDWMWYADIVLALLAALANVPIREVSPRRAVAV